MARWLLALLLSPRSTASSAQETRFTRKDEHGAACTTHQARLVAATQHLVRTFFAQADVRPRAGSLQAPGCSPTESSVQHASPGVQLSVMLSCDTSRASGAPSSVAGAAAVVAYSVGDIAPSPTALVALSAKPYVVAAVSALLVCDVAAADSLATSAVGVHEVPLQRYTE